MTFLRIVQFNIFVTDISTLANKTNIVQGYCQLSYLSAPWELITPYLPILPNTMFITNPMGDNYNRAINSDIGCGKSGHRLTSFQTIKMK